LWFTTLFAFVYSAFRYEDIRAYIIVVKFPSHQCNQRVGENKPP